VPIPILGNLTLNDIYQARKDIYGSDFGHFIGLCLFLSVASKTTFGNAYTQGLQIVPFQGLKLQ
jgi:hypothetical protein